jgi:hypothetical protein
MGDAERAERVDDGVHDRGEGADIAGLARALDTQRVGLGRNSGNPAVRETPAPQINSVWPLSWVAIRLAGISGPFGRNCISLMWVRLLPIA